MVMKDCVLCPRKCHADRTALAGYCGCPDHIMAARAGLHYYEEPFLSGLKGSGTVFFSGCSLGCVYCQNSAISGRKSFGLHITPERLSQVFLELQAKGAHNINLVTGTPYIPFIAEALQKVRADLQIPVLWNSSGYELNRSLEMLDGLIDIWLPDLKTLSPELAIRYMNAPDYPEAAKEAIKWMVRNAGPARFVPYGQDKSLPANEDGRTEYTMDDMEECGIMVSGVCVRHLVIPGQADDSIRVLEWLADTFADDIWISLMSQYTPMRTDFAQEELNRKLTAEEYDRVVDRAVSLGLENVMIQTEDAAEESFIPAFDGTGI